MAILAPVLFPFEGLGGGCGGGEGGSPREVCFATDSVEEAARKNDGRDDVDFSLSLASQYEATTVSAVKTMMIAVVRTVLWERVER